MNVTLFIQPPVAQCILDLAAELGDGFSAPGGHARQDR
jgi:hypothetical protein